VVRGTFSVARAWRLAVGPASPPTLGVTNASVRRLRRSETLTRAGTSHARVNQVVYSRRMSDILAIATSSVFLMLGLWHFYMASATLSGEGGAVPSVDGKPLFVPSKQSTVAVGLILCLFAGLVAATSGIIPSALPRSILRWLSYALALGLLARAIGEFRYVGFFKKVRGSRFAKMDTLFYSPLCLALSVGVAAVAMQSDA